MHGAVWNDRLRCISFWSTRSITRMRSSERDDIAEVFTSPRTSNELTKVNVQSDLCWMYSSACLAGNFYQLMYRLLSRDCTIWCCVLKRTRRSRWPIGLTADFPNVFAGRSAIQPFGFWMTRPQADNVFASVGGNRDDARLIKQRDCFAANEVQCFCVVLPSQETAC